MSVAAIDDYTAWAVTAMPHADDNEVVRWFEVLHGAYEACQAGGDTGWEALRAHLTELAAQQSFDPAAVEQYLTALADTGQGAVLVEHMLALADQMPGLYWQLRSGETDQAADPADPLGWVTSEQRAQVEALWGAGWEGSLTDFLNGQWGAGWEQHPDEHKVAWLRELIQSWSPQGESPTAEEAIPAEVSEELVEAALNEVLAETEGADELSAEDIAELRAEILEELAAPAQ